MGNKNYFITGGGTGGHIYPAVAVADELLAQGEANVFYVGNPDNMEADIVKDKPYTFLPVKSFGMPRKVGFQLIKWIVCMFFAWVRCLYYIWKYKPKAIFGTGGYVSAPALFAAITCNVPFMMHDCDANPGLVTRKLAPYAKCISVAFDAASDKLDNDNIFVNGNPIRGEFSTLDKSEACKLTGLDSNKLTLCVMGGSQGAQTINSAIIPIIKILSKEYNIQIIFQTGKKNYDKTVESLKNIYPEFESDKNLLLRPYFEKMYEVLKASDVAISRAGSLSISELCASGVATIFIPYPYAAADHQRKNAMLMKENGAGLYLEDSDTNPENLLKLIKSIIDNPETLANLKNNALKLAKYDGVKEIVQQLKHI